MKDLNYAIAPEVFAAFPEYRRGVVVARGVGNGDSPPELIALLRAEEDGVRQRLSLETLTAEPRLASWREAFRSLGFKPGDFRPSVEALLRRVLRGQDLPAINALADIGTVLSLRHLLPVGGHAVDVLAGDIALRPAAGSEEFIPFGSEQMEHPGPGEFIFVEGEKVLTRRWIWRQANHTLLLPGTTAVEFNLDALPPVDDTDLQAAAREAMDLVGRFCGGSSRFVVLSRESPSLSLERL